MDSQEFAASSSRADSTNSGIDIALARETGGPVNMPIPNAIYDPEGLYGIPPVVAPTPLPIVAPRTQAPSTRLSTLTQEARRSGIVLAPRPGPTDQYESEEDYYNTDEEEDVEDELEEVGQDSGVVLNDSALSITLAQAVEASGEDVGHVTAEDANMLQQIVAPAGVDMNIATIAAFDVVQPGETANTDTIPPTASQNATPTPKLVASALEPVSHPKRAAVEKLDREGVEHASPQKRRLDQRAAKDPSHESFNEGSSSSDRFTDADLRHSGFKSARSNSK